MGLGTNEVQSLTIGNGVTGTFTLTFDGQTTIAIPYNATADVIQADLVALSNIGTGNVAVTGNPGAWNITFTGNLGGEAIGSSASGLSVDGSGLTGGSASLVVSTAGAAQAADTMNNIQNADLYGIIAGDRIDASGFSGTAILSGGEGSNTLIAGSGSTTMIGGEEDNTFIAGTGNDAITGGGGTNTLIETQSGSMTIASGAVTYNGSQYSGSLSLSGSQKDVFTNIQNVVLTDQAQGAIPSTHPAFDGLSTGTTLEVTQ